MPGPWQDDLFQLLIIESTSGTLSGLFIYNGQPSAGNPPILAAVAPGVTKDPFGNPVKAVLNIGNFSGAHIGWDANGNTYLSGPDGLTRIFMANGSIPTGPSNNMDPAIWFFNDFGAAVLVVDPAAGGIFQYQDNGSAVQGTLIGSQTFKSGGANDPVFNNAVPAGVFLNDPVFSDSIQIVGGNINWNLAPFSKVANDTINQGAGSTSPYRHIAAPEQGQPGHIVQRWYGTSVDGTVPPGSVVSPTDPPVRHTSEVFEVQGNLVAVQSIPFHPGGTTEETWQTITPDAANWAQLAGAPTPQFRLLTNGSIFVKGRLSHVGGVLGASLAVNNASPIPAAYRPSNTSYYRSADTSTAGVTIGSNGIFTAFPGGSTPSNVDLTGVYWPGV